MFGKLELRCGVVEPIGTGINVSGSENSVSGTTVTTFELDGAITKFSGGTLPFCTGDKAIAAWQLAGTRLSR